MTKGPGGSLALGRPIGASGARVLPSLLHEIPEDQPSSDPPITSGFPRSLFHADHETDR
ncbi:hypothetical protein JWG42_15055 [Desulfoprunum benzoelyticum]|nr:hypothetical protein [Desulfoprunum benzoelyticum]